MNKKTREIVFAKYNGKCAYCGTELLKSWHVDHIVPKSSRGTDNIENLNPSCRDCNNYKNGQSLEEFRYYLQQLLNVKHEYLFMSKTKMQIAINLGVINLKAWDGKFYFETF
jgi:CRISPR/Cas system Type II protein with McrA/HNH and RuvC-like nuclease domain